MQYMLTQKARLAAMSGRTGTLLAVENYHGQVTVFDGPTRAIQIRAARGFVRTKVISMEDVDDWDAGFPADFSRQKIRDRIIDAVVRNTKGGCEWTTEMKTG